jgi:hypothetical protein
LLRDDANSEIYKRRNGKDNIKIEFKGVCGNIDYRMGVGGGWITTFLKLKIA